MESPGRWEQRNTDVPGGHTCLSSRPARTEDWKGKVDTATPRWWAHAYGTCVHTDLDPAFSATRLRDVCTHRLGPSILSHTLRDVCTHRRGPSILSHMLMGRVYTQTWTQHSQPHAYGDVCTHRLGPSILMLKNPFLPLRTGIISLTWARRPSHMNPEMLLKE